MTTRETTKKIALLPGDGIGPEVIREAAAILNAAEGFCDLQFDCEEALVGGAAYDTCGTPLPDRTLELAQQSDAILFGAVGGPKWEPLPHAVRPERALLGLRAALGLFANLRPAKVFAALIDASPLKRDVVLGADILVVRELTGGLYFGEPRGITIEGGERVGRNTLMYSESEIRRIAKVAFEAARKRRKILCSVDKANVLESTELWRTVVTEVGTSYPDVTLSHMYVDNAAMQIVRDPKKFDVIVTENMFGDILSDEAATVSGSIGMLPSASLNESGKGLFEPIHGSAPDIAGKDIANPLAAILSVAMMLEHTFGLSAAAAKIEAAVTAALAEGWRTADIYAPGTKKIGTREMGAVVLKHLKA